MTPKEQIGPGNRFAENVLLANILNSKDVEIRDLQQRKLVLEELLSPERTYPTSLIDRPDLPEGPVFPKRTMIVGLAIAAGLLASIALALLVDYLQRGFGRR
jgi:LPS O-antigen subunit length determinant protein (WzzB/FepE family)